MPYPALPAIALALLAAACTDGDVRSPVAKDEVVVLFPTFGRRLAGGAWEIPVHGWVYEPEAESRFRGALIEVLCPLLGIEEEAADSPIFQSRARAFLADNERGKKIPIRLGGKTHTLPESEADGHFRGTLELPAAEVERLLATGAARAADPGTARAWPARLRVEALARPGDDRSFTAEVELIGESGLSVISDIDDTIKVSEVTDRKALLENTFLTEFRAVPGMSALYRKWEARGASFHYVSSSPWQLYEPLAAFAAREGFPAGSFHLKSFRLKDRTFFSLFADPEKTKPAVIEPILETFPDRRFIFVGDSGEKDPEVYGEMARKYPAQVERILIRLVCEEEHAGSERFQAAFRGLPPAVWRLFRDAGEVPAD
jgi:hypothetical protein